MGLLWFILGLVFGLVIGGLSVAYEISTYSLWEFTQLRKEIREWEEEM